MANFTQTAIKRIAGLDPMPQPSVLPVRYPVVMMHGFGLFASLRSGGHLHDQAMHLRERGVRAYAPNVTAYDRVPVRAAMWQQRFEQIMDETRSDKLNLIAHSMGGLDARHLITTMGMHDQIASLTTISTPHHGSSIANYLMEQPGKVQDWVSELADWVGTTALADATSDFAGAIQELTPEYVTETFNSETPDHPSVRYWSYAGRAGKGTTVSINPMLRFLNNILYEREGINDGYVSVESAKWGTYLGTVDADHVAQLGLVEFGNSAGEANKLYLEIAKRLASEDL